MNIIKKLNTAILAVAMFLSGFSALSPAVALANNGNGGKENHGSEVNKAARSSFDDDSRNHGALVSSVAKQNHGAEVKTVKNINQWFSFWNNFWRFSGKNKDEHNYNNNGFQNNLYVITKPATGVTATSATVNGTVRLSDATDTSFWLGTTSAGPFASSTDPSNQLPSGWAGVDSLAKTAGSSFSYTYTGLTPETKYYFVAWSLVNGTWHPGLVLNFTTKKNIPSDTTPPNILFTTNIGSAASTTSLIWVTDEASDSKLWIGTASPVSTSTAPVATSGTLSYFHQLFAPSLATSTLYYYTVGSTDSSGNTAYYSNSFTSPSI